MHERSVLINTRVIIDRSLSENRRTPVDVFSFHVETTVSCTETRSIGRPLAFRACTTPVCRSPSGRPSHEDQIILSPPRNSPSSSLARLACMSSSRRDPYAIECRRSNSLSGDERRAASRVCHLVVGERERERVMLNPRISTTITTVVVTAIPRDRERHCVTRASLSSASRSQGAHSICRRAPAGGEEAPPSP